MACFRIFFHGIANPPFFIICKPGFGYQQPLVPGMRPAAGPMPNFFVPMVQQGQPAQRPGRRAGAGPVQQNQPIPLMQQQVCVTAYHAFRSVFSLEGVI